MRPASLTLAAALAAVLISGFAAAQTSPPATSPPAARGSAAVAPGMTRDDYIRRAAERAGKHFDRMDTNHNGILEQSEMDAWKAAHPGRKGATEPPE
jgi:hypothetical protein